MYRLGLFIHQSQSQSPGHFRSAPHDQLGIFYVFFFLFLHLFVYCFLFFSLCCVQIISNSTLIPNHTEFNVVYATRKISLAARRQPPLKLDEQLWIELSLDVTARLFKYAHTLGHWSFVWARPLNKCLFGIQSIPWPSFCFYRIDRYCCLVVSVKFSKYLWL